MTSTGAKSAKLALACYIIVVQSAGFSRQNRYVPEKNRRVSPPSWSTTFVQCAGYKNSISNQAVLRILVAF